MTINKRKKDTRHRGSHTHSGGHKKKRRGAGSRGGRGMAGTGKRGDVKKPSIWKNKKYFGRYGFKRGGASEIKAINIADIEKKLESFISKKLIKKEGDVYVIFAKKLGFDKILGYGNIKNKYKITAGAFSKDAAEKIKAAGGEAIEIKKTAPQPVKTENNKEKISEKKAGSSEEKQAEKQ